MTRDKYTFGDGDRASARLRRLAEIYEPETRDLLRRGGIPGARLAVDLGCGPGWTTRLVLDELRPAQVIGLDASERYLAEARQRHGEGCRFEQHDVTQAPFPVAAPDLLFCRFLLTHLRELRAVLTTWASVAAPGARLLVHETERLESDYPALQTYYRRVGELQAHYGQVLNVGELLDQSFAGTAWKVVESRTVMLDKPAASMAELHLENLRTWRTDPFAQSAFDRAELDGLERDLARIAQGELDAGLVRNPARQMVAVRT
jgi:ubiquinone/menaquinone biosynthesis C-methylase UbiE